VNIARRTELAQNLTAVTQRVAAACVAADRDPKEVTIVAITKTWPASDVELLVELGVRHVGENRDQEAREKAAACAGLGLTWHFVGQLQRNKAASVARYADIVESVDRPSLVAALDRGAEQAGRRLGVCIQVDLDETPHETSAAGAVRGGAAADEVLGLAEQVVGCGSLELLGVMAVAPLGVDPAPAFDRLAIIHEQVLSRHPVATMRSAGMSGDLEPAIAAGATHIRLGSALLGHREPLK
jgi:PLP dependent protein